MTPESPPGFYPLTQYGKGRFVGSAGLGDPHGLNARYGPSLGRRSGARGYDRDRGYDSDGGPGRDRGDPGPPELY